MTLRSRVISLLLISSAVTLVTIACGGETTSEVIQTQQAQNRIDNATATAAALANRTPTVAGTGTGLSQSEIARQTAIAQATAAAGTPTAGAGGEDVEMPDGPALTDADSPTVTIGDRGVFTPEVIKVKVGTTVTWTTERRSASSTTSFPGEEEQWDSGPFSKPAFGDAVPYKHTFTIPGCHRYRSNPSGDIGTGAVCVEE